MFLKHGDDFLNLEHASRITQSEGCVEITWRDGSHTQFRDECGEALKKFLAAPGKHMEVHELESHAEKSHKAASHAADHDEPAVKGHTHGHAKHPEPHGHAKH